MSVLWTLLTNTDIDFHILKTSY